MLSIQIDGEWVQADDQSLAEWMLEGRVEELTPTRDPTQSQAACPLIESLQPSQLEVFTHRVMERLPGMYVAGADSINLTALGERIGRLRSWNWADHLTRGRLEWLDGWLSELAGSVDWAVKSYDAYLRGLAQEPVLRLLAHNNRGVLRILVRQAEGVRDLACAAIPSDDNGALAEDSRLPAACFNLLNLLTHALNRHPLCDQVEDVLVDFMIQLPRRARERCLGPDLLEIQESDDAKFPAQKEDEQGMEGTLRGAPDADSDRGAVRQNRPRKRLRILKDPSFVRLTRLVVYLADGASTLAPNLDEQCTVEAVASQLRLWTVESGDGVTDLGGAIRERRRRRSRLDQCAEAASLLYASDIPSSLVPGDGSISWVKQYADRAFGLAEEYCRNSEYKLAERTLASLSEALEISRSDPLVETLTEEIAQHLQEVRRRGQAQAQLELYQTCTDLVRQVSLFCGRTDLCQAEFDADVLNRQVRKLQERLVGEDVSEGEAQALVGDLPQRIQRHLDRLRREDIGRRIAKLREQLQASVPHDWREPVSRQAYEALRKCQANDPYCLVDDWRAWRSRLDKHQAQYHFRQALADITDGSGDGQDAQEMLDQALGFDPSLTPASASLYCVLALRKLKDPPEGLVSTKADILRTARELLQLEPLGPDAVWSPAVRISLVQEACVLLERLIGAYRGLDAELDGLWQALERGFAPAFTEAPPVILREILTVVDTCLKACPVHSRGGTSRIDPRNRLYVLQRTCQKVLLTAEGEEALHQARPEDATNRFTQVIESLARDALAGDQDGQLLRRAVSGVYLAGFGGQDPLYAQRRILDELDQWVEQIRGPDRTVDCSMERILQKIADAREQTWAPADEGRVQTMIAVRE
mgnify:CR=1 FL=1